MGVKVRNDISSESTHQIRSLQIMHTPNRGLYQSCSKNCDFFYFYLPNPYIAETSRFMTYATIDRYEEVIYKEFIRTVRSNAE